MAKKRKNDWTDTSKMQLVDESIDSPEHHIRTYLERSKETDDAVTEYHITQQIWFKDGKETERFEYKDKTKTRKFLCIGGICAGTLQAKPGDDYRFFNTHESKRKDEPNSVRSAWIHLSLLQAPPKRKRGKLSQKALLAILSQPGILDDEDAD